MLAVTASVRKRQPSGKPGAMVTVDCDVIFTMKAKHLNISKPALTHTDLTSIPTDNTYRGTESCEKTLPTVKSQEAEEAVTMKTNLARLLQLLKQ